MYAAGEEGLGKGPTSEPSEKRPEPKKKKGSGKGKRGGSINTVQKGKRNRQRKQAWKHPLRSTLGREGMQCKGVEKYGVELANK